MLTFAIIVRLTTCILPLSFFALLFPSPVKGKQQDEAELEAESWAASKQGSRNVLTLAIYQAHATILLFILFH